MVDICGHEPIFSYKPKDKKKKGKTKVRTFQKIDEASHIFASISKINYPKMVYVCADTHNYQPLEVSYLTEYFDFSFPVIVVGTGGAKPDSLGGIEGNNYHYDTTSELNAEIIDSNIPFGFGHGNFSTTHLEINYKKCDSENKTIMFFNEEKEEIFYTVHKTEKECLLTKPACEFQSPEKNFLELC